MSSAINIRLIASACVCPAQQMLTFKELNAEFSKTDRKNTIRHTLQLSHLFVHAILLDRDNSIFFDPTCNI